MSYNFDAYSTTVGRSLDISDLENGVAKAMILNGYKQSGVSPLSYSLAPRNEDVTIYIVTGANDGEDDIPFFTHPLMYSATNPKFINDTRALSSVNISNIIATDFRPFTNKSAMLSGKTLMEASSSYGDYDLYVKRTVLSIPWLLGDTGYLRHNFEFAGMVYGAWISESIGRLFMLDPRDQMIVFIIAHLFYQNQFYESEIITDNVKDSFAVHTIKATRASSDMVYEVLERCGNLSSLSDMCNSIMNITDNVRLKDLSAGFIIARLGGSWFGYGAAENIAVSLEHPPTFIAMVCSAVELRTYKNTNIAKTAERHIKKANMKSIEDSYKQLKSTWLADPTGV